LAPPAVLVSLSAAVLAGRLSINALPPGNYGMAAEVVKDAWVMRIDTAYVPAGQGAWAVTLAYPGWRLGDVQLGPLIGVNHGLMFGPIEPKRFPPGEIDQPNLTLGASIRWQGDRWWITACPNIDLIWLSPAITRELQPPRPDLVLPILGSPPILEVGYQLTPELGLALRASYLPFGVSWKF
jgi:hypothetical protein